MDIDVYENKAEKLKTLSHPYRLCIVKNLIEHNCNVSKMIECLQIPQSTISQHIAKLKSAKIIEGKRNGNEITYCVIDKEVIKLVKLLFD